MAVPVSVGDYWRVQFWCNSGNQWAANRRFYVVQDVVGAGSITPDEFCEAMYFTVLDSYRGCLASQASFQGVIASVIEPYSGDVGSYQSSAAGTYLTTVAPGQLAGLISLDTGLAGRTNQGRVYVPFPPTGAYLAQGATTALYKSRMSFLAEMFRFPLVLFLGGGTVTVHCVQDPSNHDPARLFINARQSDYLATMRSRNRLYGPDTDPFSVL